jgi:phytoene synthase
VQEDLDKENRVYLPLDDMARFDYSEADLKNHVHNQSFIAMMNDQADRAEAFYQEAVAFLHPKDAKALKAAEAMRKIYHVLLEKMRADDFQVFKQRYSVSKAKKAAILLGTFLP